MRVCMQSIWKHIEIEFQYMQRKLNHRSITIDQSIKQIHLFFIYYYFFFFLNDNDKISSFEKDDINIENKTDFTFFSTSFLIQFNDEQKKNKMRTTTGNGNHVGQWFCRSFNHFRFFFVNFPVVIEYDDNKNNEIVTTISCEPNQTKPTNQPLDTIGRPDNFFFFFVGCCLSFGHMEKKKEKKRKNLIDMIELNMLLLLFEMIIDNSEKKNQQ